MKRSFVPKCLFVLYCICYSFMLKGQDANPFESIGKKAEVVTLSKGKYVEVFENDSIHRVGCVLINMNTKTIVGFLDEDSLQQVAADNSEHSRWYQQDPMMEEYYDYSPYNYTLNNPVNYTDPDGMLVVKRGDNYVITGDDIFTYYGYLNTIASGQGSMANLYQGLEHASSLNDGAGGDLTGTLGGVTAIGHGKQTLTVPGSSSDPGFLASTLSTRPTREPYTGVFGTLDYLWSGGNYRGTRYDMSGNPIGRSPNMGLPPDIGIGKVNGAAKLYSIYRSFNAAGKVNYVGLTSRFARRAAEHLRTKGIDIISLMSNLSLKDARAVEQALIEIHKLGKNGGTLMNKINSIARTNPEYATQVQRGFELLQKVGYSGL